MTQQSHCTCSKIDQLEPDVSLGPVRRNQCIPLAFGYHGMILNSMSEQESRGLPVILWIQCIAFPPHPKIRITFRIVSLTFLYMQQSNITTAKSSFRNKIGISDLYLCSGIPLVEHMSREKKGGERRGKNMMKGRIIILHRKRYPTHTLIKGLGYRVWLQHGQASHSPTYHRRHLCTIVFYFHTA